jgi:lactate permease
VGELITHPPIFISTPNILTAFWLSLFPILLILVLMVGRRWSATRAGAAGYLAALAIAWGYFGATPTLVAYAQMKALLFSLDVLLIIWAAFLLYRVVDEAGAIRTIGLALPRLTPDRSLQALIIGWVFASFLQGVGGFGVPVAVTSPLLVSLGLSPLAAVLVPSLGHGWAVTFGSMGSSFQALLTTSGLTAEVLSPPAALFLGISCPVIGVMIAHVLGGWPEVRRLLFPVLVWGAVMAIVQYVVVVSGLWNLGSFIGGMAGLLVTPLLMRAVARTKDASTREPAPVTPGLGPSSGPLLVALTGYVILIVVTLVVQLNPALKEFFGQVVLQVQFPEIVSGLGYVTPAGAGRKINLFGHTGSLLVYSAILAYLVYRRAGLYRPGAARRIVDGTLRRVMTSSVSILSMISMALIMEHTGMTQTLAVGLARATGALFPLVAPWIGAIGAFMTGSNTNSNVVFTQLQMTTAEFLGYSVPVILAAQTAGASLASVTAPAKVVVGASTTGMAGKEGVVMRRLAGYTALLLALISLLTLLGTIANP